ncbi:MAG: PIN domain-containing protein [Bacteroidota bacterium]|nr:PIN domain-containing protein [Bacteroidota bacterium]MDP4234549.1 PIN domain-containing protein [Bacteroidota bacterium]MDP4242614.1 PIN domain-containing protein [Bacteroidota bacterium]MDP4289190.1 PIN domain-containing protein [Bacteroidota bacterium]
MKKLNAYLDTSVIGGCFDEGFEEASRALMNLIRIGVYDGMISAVTEEELSNAPDPVRTLLDEFDDEQIIRLVETPAVLALSDAYMTAKVVPVKFKDDASHIAYATVHGADVVVSWNFCG